MTVRTSITGLIASLGQSLLPLSFNLCGILAGTLLALYFKVFSLAPWALALFPGILSVRGAIGGLFSGHLSTGLHLGTVKPSYTKNTPYFYLLLHAVIGLTFESSVVIGFVALLFNVFLGGIPLLDSFSAIIVVIATMGLSIVFISPLTIVVSFLSFKHGLDPDVALYPVTSTVDDTLVTLCYILELNIFFSLPPFGSYLVGLIGLIFLCIVSYVVVKHIREALFVKMIREFFVTLLFVAFIVNVTGSFLNRIRGFIGSRSEVYVVYPALIDTVGDVGSIVGSTATTKLFLGVMKPSFSSIKQHSIQIVSAWMASLVMFTLYSVLPFTFRIATLKYLPRFMVQLMATNMLAVSVMVVISFAVAILTYRRGWDPDNFVIPIESSLADSLTTISLLAALSAIG